MVLPDGGIALNQVPGLRLRPGASDFTLQCKDPVYGSAGLFVHPIVTSLWVAGGSERVKANLDRVLFGALSCG